MSWLRPFRKLNYANVMASLALLIALGGTSYAAVKIDGSHVRDNSLTGRDVKNGSLTGRDVKDRSIGPRDLKAKLVGKPGPRGVAGLRGAPGPQGSPGQRGPSLGTFSANAGSDTLTPSLETIESLSLEAGNWIVSSSGFMKNDGTSNAIGLCGLFIAVEKPEGGIRFEDVIAETGNVMLHGSSSSIPRGAEGFAMNGAQAFEKPTQVHLMCMTGKEQPAVRALNTNLTAIRTADLTNQTKRTE